MKLKALLRVRLKAYTAYYSGASRSRKRQSKAQKLCFAALMLYAAVAIAMLFYTSFSQLAGVYAALRLEWLYFAMYAVMAFALMVFGTVFTAKVQLFEAKDNDLLLAMPIRPRDILFSRMASLLAMNVVLELIVAVPVLLAWYQAATLPALGILSFALLLLSLPCLALAVTSLLAWLLSLLSGKVRNKALMTTIGSLIFLGAYFAVIFRMNNYMALLVRSGERIADKLSGAAILVWLGKAMAGQGAVNLALSLLVTLVPFAAAYAILSRSFVSIVTTKHGFAKLRYEEKALKTSSVDAALLKREFQHLGASPTYLLNSGLGVLFLLAAAVVLAIRHEAVSGFFAQLPELAESLPVLLLLAIGGMTGTTFFTPGSVSIEGKNLWILQSLPVTGYQALRAKLRMANLLTLPAAGLAGLSCAFVTGQWPLVTLAAVLFALFSNLFGLRLGILHAKLDWVNEAQAVKQGWAVMIAMFGCWGIIIAVGALWMMWLAELTSAAVFLLGFSAVLLAVNALLLRWLKTRGAERFSALS